MDYIVDTEGITLIKNNNGDYTLILYDIYGHYDTELIVRKEQLYDLLIGLENIRKDIEDTGIM